MRTESAENEERKNVLDPRRSDHERRHRNDHKTQTSLKGDDRRERHRANPSGEDHYCQIQGATENQKTIQTHTSRS